MMADFEGPGVDDRFRRLLSKAQPIKWGLFHHPKTSTYYRDRVVLIGDSAHASLPFQAAGAAQGLEDALVLLSVLGGLIPNATHECGSARTGRINAALAAYDHVRRPRAQKQLEQSAEMQDMIFLQHKEAGADMNKILVRLQQGRFEWLWFHDPQKDAEEAINVMQHDINNDIRAS
jgi:salicylate hydroxylase